MCRDGQGGRFREACPRRPASGGLSGAGGAWAGRPCPFVCLARGHACPLWSGRRAPKAWRAQSLQRGALSRRRRASERDGQGGAGWAWLGARVTRKPPLGGGDISPGPSHASAREELRAAASWLGLHRSRWRLSGSWGGWGAGRPCRGPGRGGAGGGGAQAQRGGSQGPLADCETSRRGRGTRSSGPVSPEFRDQGGSGRAARDGAMVSDG